MQVHHLQAVEMSFLARDRAEDPEIRQLAYDIARTQQHQAGQMYGWLSTWGLPKASPEPAMAWMDEGAGHSSPHDAGQQSTAMPGMATAAQLEALTDAEGSEAEQLYLELMISHHQAGTTMAQAVLDRTDNEAVRALAQHGKVAPVTIHHRIDFAASMVDGRTVGEFDPGSRSAEEVASLWLYVNSQLRKYKAGGTIDLRK